MSRPRKDLWHVDSSDSRPLLSLAPNYKDSLPLFFPRLPAFFNRPQLPRQSPHFVLARSQLPRESPRFFLARPPFLLAPNYRESLPFFFALARFTERVPNFLTARPWAERGSCSARDLLVVVVVVVFFLSVTRPKPPLGQITIGTESRNLGCLFAKSCWNNDVREMLRIMFSF